MNEPDLDRIVDEYLDRLDAALVELRPARRHRLVAELAEHVEQARAELPEQTEVALRALLDRVGLPEDIAAAALADSDDRMSRPLPAADPPTGRPDRRLVGGLIGLAVLLAVGIVLAVTLSGGTAVQPVRRASVTTTTGIHAGDVVTVPNVVGEPATLAIQALQSVGLSTGTAAGPKPTQNLPAGSVVSQRPPAGTSMTSGSEVTLSVATSTITTVPATSSAPTTTTTQPASLSPTTPPATLPGRATITTSTTTTTTTTQP